MSTLEDVPAPAESNVTFTTENALNRSLRWILPVVFSLFYFCDVLLRASGKFYWYDEIFTVYFSRLPTLGSLWSALQSGIDFNPPLFYLLTRASQTLFGQGQIATRLPEILGFWIFCLCLFQFVDRRAGPLGGLVAMLLPTVTQAYYWAYEARPHGIVVGCCGLAMVCWQRSVETPRLQTRWLAGFSISLFCACMMHCYAITLLMPFCVVELYRTIRRKRVEWPVWMALIAPAVLAIPVYIPLLHSYRSLADVTTFPQTAPAGWTQFEHFYYFLCKGCILCIVAAVVLFGVDVYQRRRNTAGRPPEAVLQDLVLALAFLSLPFTGIVLGKIVQGPFFSRYFLSAVAGLCIVAGFGAGLRQEKRWIALTLALVIGLTAGTNFGRLLVARSRGSGEGLLQPDAQFLLDTTPGKPLLFHSLLTSSETSLAVAVLSPLDFLYLVVYAPQFRQRLYFVSPSSNDFTYVAFKRFLQCCQIQFNPPLTTEEFLRNNPSSLLYGDPSNFNDVATLSRFGTHLGKMQVLEGHFLVHLEAN